VTTRSFPYTTDGSFAPFANGGGARPGAPPGLASDADILGRAKHENFKVASRLLPEKERRHLLAFYGYARLVDEIGDSYPGDRLAALDWIEAETFSALAGPGAPGLDPLVADAARSVRALSLDPAPLFKLIAANRQDQGVTAYETFEDLLGYCALSADPVGHLVLGAFGAVSAENLRHSDSICSGLQLVEHWQDVAEDAAAGRVYLPQEDLARFGVSAGELRAGELRAGAPASRSLRALMVFEAARARRMLDEGAPLIAALSGRLRWAVAGFWAGGQASIDALADRGFDPLAGRAAPARRQVAVRMLAAWRQAREAA
jgi:squalene synthase HpnC